FIEQCGNPRVSPATKKKLVAEAQDSYLTIKDNSLELGPNLKVMRHYKRKTDRANRAAETIYNAVQAHLVEGRTLADSSRLYGIPVRSLARYCQRAKAAAAAPAVGSQEGSRSGSVSLGTLSATDFLQLDLDTGEVGVPQLAHWYLDIDARLFTVAGRNKKTAPEPCKNLHHT
ncbi:unnamed protein product, partial [Nesidiocoris tenuis]